MASVRSGIWPQGQLPVGETIGTDELDELMWAPAIPSPRIRVPLARGIRRAPAATAKMAVSPALEFAPDVHLPPFRAVVCLRIFTTVGGRPFRGSAFFIDKHVLATAGHVANFADVTRLEVVVDLDGSLNRASTYVAAAWQPFEGFVAAKVETDFGVVILNEAVGAAVGAFGLRVASDAELAHLVVDVDGYPEESLSQLGFQTQLLSPGILGDDVLTYRAGTRDGQSGGVIFAPGGAAEAVGIHAALGSGFAAGARITQEVFDWLVARSA